MVLIFRVGECVIIGKYPSAWNKKVRIPPPQAIAVDHSAVQVLLKELRKVEVGSEGTQPLNLKGLVKALYVKAAKRIEKQEPTTSTPEDSPLDETQSKFPSSGSDPNF